MKTVILLIVFLFVNCNSASSAPIDSIVIQKFQVEKLVSLCKVWGFLKYYHPKVAAGEFNWDEKLFEILPKIELAKNKKEFSTVMEQWIERLGKVDAVGNKIVKKKVDYFDKNFDLSWIEKNQLFSKNLQQKLRFVEKNRIVSNQHYVEFIKTVDHLSIINEKSYPNFKWENDNLRMLLLFRYWNYVEYFFPYKYQMTQNWNTTLNEFIPKFIERNSELNLHLTTAALIAKLDDSHATIKTAILDDYFGNNWIASRFKIINKKAIITRFYNDSLAKIDDLKMGDEIIEIDDKPVADLINERWDYISGSNNAVKNRNLRFALLNGQTNSAKIKYIRDSQINVKTIKRYSDKVLNIGELKHTPWKIIDGNIGVVNMKALKLKINTAFKELTNTKAIIFDLRNDSSLNLVEISSFLNDKQSEFIRYIFPDLHYPGRFIWQQSRKCGSERQDHYKGKVVLLLNEFAQSSFEYMAMGFQTAPNITLVGSQTAGANGAICSFNILDGFPTRITSVGVFYPDKRETQRIGIVPNIVVQETIKGIRDGKDEVIERAIEFINLGK